MQLHHGSLSTGAKLHKLSLFVLITSLFSILLMLLPMSVCYLYCLFKVKALPCSQEMLKGTWQHYKFKLTTSASWTLESFNKEQSQHLQHHSFWLLSSRKSSKSWAYFQLLTGVVSILLTGWMLYDVHAQRHSVWVQRTFYLSVFDEVKLLQRAFTDKGCKTETMSEQRLCVWRWDELQSWQEVTRGLKSAVNDIKVLIHVF